MSRRIDIIGGGPGGLYAARLLKVARPDWDVTVHERMSGSADTFGFGVSLTVSTMANLEAADPASAADIREVSWSGHGLRLLGEHTSVDLHGAGNLAIARSSMLDVLGRHATAAGVVIRAGAHAEASALDSDVVIAADGVRSATREKLTNELGADVSTGRGMYLWCGSDFALDDAIFAPARSDHGLFVAHAYPYAPGRSTFLLEADMGSWRNAGMDVNDAVAAEGASDEASIRYLEAAFAQELHGRRLLANRSRWSRFYTVHLDHWSHGNTVLIGDAAHTAHYTLGSGTKLALEDAIALSRALLDQDDISAAFAAYEAARRPAVRRFQYLAGRSQRWWESYFLRADQPIATLAVGFMTRAGNISLEKFAGNHWDVVRAALASYSPSSPLPDGPGAVNAWVLSRPYPGLPEAPTRVIGPTQLPGHAEMLRIDHDDPWSPDLEHIVQRARQSNARSLVWLTGDPGREHVHVRLDLAERIKLQTTAAVGVDVTSLTTDDAAAALVAGRCDLVRITKSPLPEDAMEVTAAVADKPGAPLELKKVQLQDLQPGEIRVKVVATGICHADVLARDQAYPVPLPAVLGHEGAGIIEEVGAGVSTLAPGDHVVLGFNFCGSCPMCASGHPSNCATFFEHNFGGYRLDGSSPLRIDGSDVAGWFFGQSSFASHVNVAARLAVKVAPDVPLDVLGPLGCGVMTGAGAVLNVLNPHAGSSFAVFGTGAVGFSGLLAAKVAGCATIIAVDVVGSRLQLARELGATHVVNAASGDPVEQIRDITAGAGVDYALDAVGITDVFTQMASSLAVRGHGVLVGAPAPGQQAALDIGSLLFTSQRLSMVLEGDSVPQTFIPELIRLYQAGLFPFDKLIKHYPLEQINTAIGDAEAGRTVKPVVVFDR